MHRVPTLDEYARARKSSKPFRGTIEQWRKVSYDDGNRIVGIIEVMDNDTRFYQGFVPGRTVSITTSQVVSMDGKVVETLNSTYHLGKAFGED